MKSKLLTIILFASTLLLTACGVDVSNSLVTDSTGSTDTTGRTDTTGSTGSSQQEAQFFISNYANNGGGAPSVKQYFDAGVSGVTADNLAQVNSTILALTGTDVDSTAKTQAIIQLISQASTAKLNDTGITWAGEYPNGNNLDCTSNTISAPQDCSYGRDAGLTSEQSTFIYSAGAESIQIAKVGGGAAGFDFTKLDKNGNPLDIQNTAWANGGIGAEIYGSKWSCVQDNVTGLIWEVKTNEGSLHYKYNSYNWYNNDFATNGGSEGYADNDGDICFGYNSTNPASFCNTQVYVARVNSEGWCGASDWRLPELKELRSIINYGKYNPSIDTSYFPNTVGGWFWSSSPYASDSGRAWAVSFINSNYNDGYRDNDYRVRLVRSSGQ